MEQTKKTDHLWTSLLAWIEVHSRPHSVPHVKSLFTVSSRALFYGPGSTDWWKELWVLLTGSGKISSRSRVGISVMQQWKDMIRAPLTPMLMYSQWRQEKKNPPFFNPRIFRISTLLHLYIPSCPCYSSLSDAVWAQWVAGAAVALKSHFTTGLGCLFIYFFYSSRVSSVFIFTLFTVYYYLSTLSTRSLEKLFAIC